MRTTELIRKIMPLALAQACFLASSMAAVSFAGLVGAMLAPDRTWATLPMALVMTATWLMTAPVSLMMARHGRRSVFLLGATMGLFAGLLAVFALLRGSFLLFSLAMVALGGFQATGQYYRFAAADGVAEPDRGRAISYVLLGGILAALIVPTLIGALNDAFVPYSFMGAFVFIAGVTALAMVPLSRVADDVSTDSPEDDRPPRPLVQIIRHSAFAVAVLNAAAGYAMMSFVMTATPLAMQVCGFDATTGSEVIQGHVIAMFLPSLFTGQLIARFGVMPVLLAGQSLFALAFAVALTGIEIEQFSIALIALGLGWNFCFIGGTTLLTSLHTPAERGRVQGLNEFLVFGLAALASLASGVVLRYLGWDGVNRMAFVLLAVTAAVTLFHILRQTIRKARMKEGDAR